MRFFNQRGQAIMQAMIAALVTGMVAMTTIALINRQKKEGTESQVVLKTLEIQKKIQNLLRDDLAWQSTVADSAKNPTMSCLTGTQNCNGQAGGAIVALHDSSGATYYDTTSASSGFKETGETCTTYSATAGSEDNKCPYRVAITWKPINAGTSTATGGPVNCSTTTPCDAYLTGTITYSPSTAGQKERVAALKSSKYTFNWARESRTRQDYFVVVDQQASGVVGGSCDGTPGAIITRRLNTTVIDTGNNVQSVIANAVTLKAGTYYCEVTAPTNGVATHQAYIDCPTASPTKVRGSTSYYYAPSIVSGQFTLAATGAFTVKHLINPGPVPIVDPGSGLGQIAYQTCLGKPASIAGQNEIYTQVRCRRISQ